MKWTAGQQLDHISIVHTIENPEGKKQNHELNADRPETRSPASTYHGAGADSDTHEHDVEAFAKELCRLLEKDHHEGKFSVLQIAAGPHLLGVLRKNLGNGCEQALSKTVNKNLIHADEKELLEHFS